jgi:hypothetical protein
MVSPPAHTRERVSEYVRGIERENTNRERKRERREVERYRDTERDR